MDGVDVGVLGTHGNYRVNDKCAQKEAICK